MLKKIISPLFAFPLLFLLGCGETPSNNTANKMDSKVETSAEKEATTDEQKIIGTWQYQEEGGKYTEKWSFTNEEFVHEGSGSMTFTEKGLYSVENIKNGTASLVLSEIKGNMGTDDRTILINLGSNLTEINVNNLTFKKMEKK